MKKMLKKLARIATSETTIIVICEAGKILIRMIARR